MKKLFLLLATGCVAMNAVAQESQPVTAPFVQKGPGDREINISALHREFNAQHSAASGAHKTTAGGDRWYNYGVYMTLASDFDRSKGSGTLAADYVYGYPLEIWNDTFGIMGYTTPSHLNRVSVANILQPQFSGFNRVDLYTGSPVPMRVGAGDAYTVDSVVIPGGYYYGSNSNVSVVDTLRLAFVTGNGGASSTSSIFTGGLGGGGHYGTASFFNCAYDSVKNRGAGTSGGSPAQYMDILLRNSDTSSTKLFVKKFQIVDASGTAAPISVPAGNFIGCTITFKSGQAGIFSSLPGDTLRGAVAPYTRYNMFRPVVDYYTQTDPASVTTTIPSADWAPYNFTLPAPDQDGNTGAYKNLPNSTSLNWGKQYIPLWAWSSGSNASILQYPEVGYHVTCATCVDVPLGTSKVNEVYNVSAVPNPADDKLTITFSLIKSSDVSISISNMLGQVVATQNLSNTVTGSAVFNTTAIPAGVYVYTVDASGTRLTTGRVVVAH